MKDKNPKPKKDKCTCCGIETQYDEFENDWKLFFCELCCVNLYDFCCRSYFFVLMQSFGRHIDKSDSAIFHTTLSPCSGQFGPFFRKNGLMWCLKWHPLIFINIFIKMFCLRNS